MLYMLCLMEDGGSVYSMAPGAVGSSTTLVHTEIVLPLSGG